MMARYYSPETAFRFLVPDPGRDSIPDAPQTWNLYAYVRNNPINLFDPSGAYARGSGWSDRNWKKFNKAQTKAAGKAEKAAGDLRGAAAAIDAGGKLSRKTKKAIKKFGNAVGAGSNTADRMRTAADKLAGSATALNDDGSLGYTADALTGQQWQAQGLSMDEAARANPGGKEIAINTGNTSLGFSKTYQFVVTHESLHNAPANMSDQSIGGQKVYSRGRNPGLVNQLATQNPNAALRNPDNILRLIYPF